VCEILDEVECAWLTHRYRVVVLTPSKFST